MLDMNKLRMVNKKKCNLVGHFHALPVESVVMKSIQMRLVFPFGDIKDDLGENIESFGVCCGSEATASIVCR